MDDSINRQAAIDAMSESLKRVFPEHRQIAEKCLNVLPSAQSDLEAKILAAGYTGKEVRIYIGGRLFGVRELAQ